VEKSAPAKKDADFDVELQKAKPKASVDSVTPKKPQGKKKSAKPAARKATEQKEVSKKPAENSQSPLNQAMVLDRVGSDRQTAESAESVGEVVTGDVKKPLSFPVTEIIVKATDAKPQATPEADDESKTSVRVNRVAARAVDVKAPISAVNTSAQENPVDVQPSDARQQDTEAEIPSSPTMQSSGKSVEPLQPAKEARRTAEQSHEESARGAKTSIERSPDTVSVDPQEMEDLEADVQAGTSSSRSPTSAPAPHHSDAVSDVLSTFQEKLNAAQPLSSRAEAPPPSPAPETQFAADNHSKIISGIRSELIPGGGTMHIRLDPPELGALQVTVHMEDGVMTASFHTTSDDATRLLSHSLSQLKHVLESQGISVDKLHVQQSPRDQRQSFDDSHQQRHSGNSSAQQEQQRREMLRRMWRRLTNGSDPLDMVA
jgi:flagellar hook-length control protein FliK